MKDLFCGFLNVSLSGSFVILVILLLRFLLRKGRRQLSCLLWVATFVRLLLPFQIPVPWSLMPTLPIVSGSDTRLLGTPQPILQESIPDFIPKETLSQAGRQAVVDHVAILGWLWVMGMAAMLLYMLISYGVLRYKLRNASLLEKGIYRVGGLESAILLGYFPPRVYLPGDLDARSGELVIAHELMHKKRGDHWLKLLAFVCLAAHWFNPLVWLGYHLLCQDVEAACDEQVVKNLGTEEKKAYCTALLACGKPRGKKAVCPVAFGEVSLPQRIKAVLSGHKPVVWISAVALVAVIFVSLFLLTDPLSPKALPQYYTQLEHLIGEPVDTVCQSLGITKEQLGEEIPPGIYQPALKAEYMGIEFDVVLLFSVDTRQLGAFRYVAAYEGITEAAAEDAAKVARQLWKNYGKGYQWELKEEPELFKTITGDDVFAIHQNVYNRTGTFTIRDLWNLTDSAPENVTAFLWQMELSELWQNSYGELSQRYGVKPACYLEFFTDVSKTEEVTMLVLEYRTGWIPGRYSTMTIEN